MPLKAKLENGILKFELPMQKPKVSGSGKNLVLAATRGQVHTGIEYEGSDVIIVANAYVENKKPLEDSGHRRRKRGHTHSVERHKG